MDDRGVAEAYVDRRRACHALECAIERFEPELPRLLGPRLHVGLVDLDDVGARRKEVADLGVERRCIVDRREMPAAAVVVDLGLLRHRERPRHGDLDGLRRMAPQEFEIPHADWVPPADRPDDARYRHRMPAAVERRARIVEVDALERGRKQVRVAFATDLAIGDDVEPRLFLRSDCDDRRVVLRLARCSAGTRHNSRARTRGGNRPASFLRSISQSGWGMLPTSVVGKRVVFASAMRFNLPPGARCRPIRPRASHARVRAKRGSHRRAG